MHSDDANPVAPDDDAARLIQEALDPIAPTPAQREALLRRILERTGGQRQPQPAPPSQPD